MLILKSAEAMSLTIYDISKKAGVSIATVSRVINGSPKVSPATKEKVMRIIEESGYSPNVFARGLGLNTMNTIGILCADSSDPFLAEAVYYIEQRLRDAGYDVLLCCTGYELAQKQKCMDMLISKRVDALIMVGSNYIEEQSENNAYIRHAAQKIPVMILNGALDAPNVYCTLSDDFGAMCDLAGRFISAGHTDILYLYNSNSYSGRSKLGGFREAFRLAELTLPKENVRFFNSRDKSVSDISDYLQELHEKGQRFSAVMCADDKLAVGAIKFAHRCGLRVPDELAVTGFNNLSIATYCEPELTSVDNKLESICSHCVTALINILNNVDTPKKTLFSYELVERGSTALPKQE